MINEEDMAALDRAEEYENEFHLQERLDYIAGFLGHEPVAQAMDVIGDMRAELSTLRRDLAAARGREGQLRAALERLLTDYLATSRYPSPYLCDDARAALAESRDRND